MSGVIEMIKSYEDLLGGQLAEINTLKAENSSLRTDLETANTKIQTLESENASLKGRMTAAENRLDRL
jgi:FtsZ-binding cell division protein ZapB